MNLVVGPLCFCIVSWCLVKFLRRWYLCWRDNMTWWVSFCPLTDLHASSSGLQPVWHEKECKCAVMFARLPLQDFEYLWLPHLAKMLQQADTLIHRLRFAAFSDQF